MTAVTTQLVADIRADLARFQTGADPTLDVENILDLIDLYERAVADRVRLRAEVADLRQKLAIERRSQ